MTRWQSVIVALAADSREHLTARRVAWATILAFVVGSVIDDFLRERGRIATVRRDTIADLTARADDISARLPAMRESEFGPTDG
jgi:hypothetical protein